MKILQNPTPKLVFLTMVLAVIGSLAQGVGAEEMHRWEVKAGLVLADFDDPLVFGTLNDDRYFISDGSTGGTQIALEYRASRLIGYELSLAHVVLPDVERDIANGSEDVQDGPLYLPIVAGINLHVLNTEKFDVYFGPRFAYATLDDVDITVGDEVQTFAVDNEYGWGVATGFSYRLGDRWSFTADATYLDVDLDITTQAADDTVELSLDPLTFVIGASYRF